MNKELKVDIKTQIPQFAQELIDIEKRKAA